MAKGTYDIVGKLSVTSRCNCIDKKRNKIQNDSPGIQYLWRDHKQLCCIRFYDVSVVLNFGD
jgi:hypothetical protein